MMTQFTTTATVIHPAFCDCIPCLRDEKLRSDYEWERCAGVEFDDW